MRVWYQISPMSPVYFAVSYRTRNRIFNLCGLSGCGEIGIACCTGGRVPAQRGGGRMLAQSGELGRPSFPQNYLSDKALLGDWITRCVQEEGAFSVSSYLDVPQDGRDWAELVTCAPGTRLCTLVQSASCYPTNAIHTCTVVLFGIYIVHQVTLGIVFKLIKGTVPNEYLM